MRWLQALRDYPENSDPRAAAGNTIALVVAGNQPFYPLYLYLFVGGAIAPGLATLLATPLFLAIPAVARRHGIMGRAMLPLAGIANTVCLTKLFGPASGVELFLLPCALIAALSFRRGETAVAVALIGLALVSFAGLHPAYGAPLASYNTEEYRRFFRMNAYSAVTLSAFTLLTFTRTILRERSALCSTA